MHRIIAPALALLLTVTAATAEVPRTSAQLSLSFAPVVRQAAPAVVNIYARTLVDGAGNPFAGSPFEELMRGMGRVVPRVKNALGSGVILTPDGLVVTNYHVAGGADAIKVVLSDRREFSAEVVISDKRIDLVLLRLEGAGDLPTIPLAPRASLSVGDLVLAIGNPYGIGQTVSSGIVSALARTGLAVGDRDGFFIQTDAPINPGNSGGALVDIEGRLVAINTAIFSRSGGSNGIGFAIPVALVRQFLLQAQAGAARFRRPWGGITAQPVDADLAASLGLDRPQGVLINAFGPASPFREAGLSVGDLVLSVGGEEVNTPQGLLFQMEAAGIGSALELTYLSDGERHSGHLQVVAAPETPPRSPVTIPQGRPFAGLSAEQINPAVIEEMGGLPINAEGVVVRETGLLGRRIGLEPGDIIRRVNGRAITTTADLARAAGQRVARWEVVYERGGERRAVRFRL